jgi:acyl-CoA synthetase (AMP-forming)/AMP-acid ligase II
MGDKLIELYGFSEGFATMLKPGAPADKFDTVGIPVLGFEVRILDESGQVLGPGEIGEIAGYGPGMMSCYHGKAAETATNTFAEGDATFQIKATVKDTAATPVALSGATVTAKVEVANISLSAVAGSEASAGC